MIGFAQIAGGAPSSVQAMTNHLLAETIPREQADIAAYYATGARPPTAEQLISDDVIVARFAKAVADGVMQEDAVIALAVEAKRKADLNLYRDDLSPPERVADLHARLYLAGMEDLEEARAGAEAAARSLIFANRDDPDRFDKAAEWAQERLAKAIDGYEAEEYALERKYIAAFERARQVREFGNNPLVALRRDMHPLVARSLGVDPERPILDPEQINALISGHRADGAKIDGKHYAPTRPLPVNPNTGKKRISQAIGSYDFCPSPDKSVSVAWAFAPPPERAMIYNAHIDAARKAVAYIGREIGLARHGDDRSEIVPGHVGWLEFTHYTARKTRFTIKDGMAVRGGDETIPGDPDLHTHFLIPNAVFCDDGRVGSLHTARIAGFLREATSVYHATLAQNITDSGFDAVMDPKLGVAVMKAVPRDVCTLYSKRRNMGELLARKFAESRGENWDELSDDQKERRMDAAVQNPVQRKYGDKDDMADVASWKEQAKEIGWDYPASFQAYGPLAPEMAREQRLEAAYEASLDFIERKLERASVITRWDLRAAAGYGLVHSGSRDPIQDINAVTHMMRERGVRQYGEMTALAWGHETGERHVSVTTALHIDQEKEFIALGKKAAADHGSALPRALLDQTIRESGLDFSGEHGRAQLAMIYRLGTGGRLSASVAAAGAGKSAALSPLVAAWKLDGRTVHGASLAWRQADDLVQSGIAQQNVKAFDVLIRSAKSGDIKLDKNSVVAVDEFALLGTRQGLELLRLQDRHGFQIVALGDPKQCAAVSAGDVVSLARRTLGSEQIPHIETTVRQQSDREKEIVGLLREGKARQAIDMKLEDGTALMVPGGYNECVERVAKLYAERLKDTGQAPSITVPTNFDAHQVSIRVRTERKKVGMVGADVKRIDAEDLEGRRYEMRLAPGDRVRLFKSIGQGLRNGSVVDVVSVDGSGIRIRSKPSKGDDAGKERFVPWSRLLTDSGRISLAYGDALTIHSAQSMTRDEHIYAFPSGSQAVNGLAAYSAGTRHRHKAWLVTSDVAEMREVKKHRPINDHRDVTTDDKWANVASNFAYQPEKDLALAMLERVETLRRGTVMQFPKMLHIAHMRQSAGEAPSFAHEKAEQKWLAASILGQQTVQASRHASSRGLSA